MTDEKPPAEVARVARLMDDGDAAWTKEPRILIEHASAWRDTRDLQARRAARKGAPDAF